MNAKSIILFNQKREFTGTIQLTGSKSESNRALILQALSKGEVSVKNLSSADDTVTLNRILKSLSTETASSTANFQSDSADAQLINVGPAGTAMRFLTAYCSINGIDAILTGTERMKQRPIGILVNALRTLGAQIDYVEADGFPPINTKPGFEQKINRIQIKGDISSQYITALLLVAPALPNGLEVEILGELTSRPYVEMTLGMMEQTGIRHNWKDNSIQIDSQPFSSSTLIVEPDWSAASYWYSIVALSKNATIKLPYLRKYSLQGDSRITEIMANFGVTSVFDDEGVTLTKQDKPFSNQVFDFKDCPDLAQTVIVCCAALGHNATFTGLETLKIKETDRVLALQTELAKIGVTLTENDQTYYLDSSKKQYPEKVTFHSYEDHRMAMAFAPLALVINQVEIEDPAVVNKSYPHFWDDLKKAGFDLN